MNTPIYIVLGLLVVVYLVISISNRNKSKQRSTKKFMGDYKRKDKKD